MESPQRFAGCEIVPVDVRRGCKGMKITVKHVGKCAWCGTIDDLLSMDRGVFKRTMRATNCEVSDYVVGQSNYKAWKDEFKHLRAQEVFAGFRHVRYAFLPINKGAF